MPAVTNNDTILKAINQMVQALLDLNIGSGGGGGDCPDVTVNLPAPVVNVTVRCGGCGGGGGSTPPQTPGEEGGTPPPGTGTPDPIDDRKCKVAHILIHELIAYTDNMAALGLFDFTLDYSSLGGILNSLANGFKSGLLSLVFQVGGWLQNLQNLIFSGGLGASIPETLSANQDDMICALYNAKNVSDAKADVVAASGLTGKDAEYLRVILTTEALNMLFFSIPGSEGVISNYQGGNNCNCGGGLTHWIIKKYEQYTYGSFGTLYDGEVVEGGIVSNNFQVISWHSIWDNMRMLGLTGNEGEGVSIRLKLELFGFTPRDDFNGNCVTIYWADKSQQTYSAAQISTFYALMSDMEISADPALGFQLVSSTDFTANVTVL